jgi:hypothetical protein
MTTKRLLILIIATLIATSVCQAQGKRKTGLQEANLKGKVKSVRSISHCKDKKKDNYSFLDFSGTGMELYDTNGNLIVSYDSVGDNLRGKVLYFYDEKGNLTELHLYSADGISFEKKTFRDISDNLRERSTYDYVNDVLVIRKDTMEYDNDGNIIRTTFHRLNDGTSHSAFYKYDEKGHLIESSNYFDSVSFNFDTFRYNKNGDLIEQKTTEACIDAASISKYKYKYDKNGNWIKQTEKNTYNSTSAEGISKTNKTSYVTQRTIEYYD